MPRRLTPRSSLDNLKREAKRWLKALRSNVGEARARLERALPDAPQIPTLRHVQHALARELGFGGWTELKHRVATAPARDDSLESLVTQFLDNACPDHHVRGGPDHVRASHTAMRLLARYPEIEHANFYTSVVCGDVATVERVLAEQPGVASRREAVPSAERSDVGGSGDLYHKNLGSKGWEPLLYLCFTRLPLPAVAQNAVAIARTLLDRGADPNAYFMAGDSRYTPLVGAIGEGEENRPPHPARDELVRLLLARGAEPYDIQVVYNIHFHGDVLWFLELIYDRTVQLGRKSDWDAPEWPMLNMGNYGSGARWHLDLAVKHNDSRLAEWCLEHGASANAAPPRDERFSQRTLYEEAVRRGRPELAELLVRYGATRTEVALSDMEHFVAACLRLDRDELRAQLERHPEYLRAPEPLFEAARQDRADIVELLLDLGVSPDAENKQKERALHIAAYQNSMNVARLLIARGAEIDPVESNWNNTPLGAAVYAQHAPMIDLLSSYSRDVWELTYSGKLARLREVLAESPELARVVGGGHTPLMWLPPDDEANAIEVARLLLAHGADPTLRNKQGMTAAERAEKLGMFDAAEMLRAAVASASGHPALEPYERKASHLLEAYRTGTPEAMQRHWNDTWHRRTWQAMRRYVQLDLGKRAESHDGEGAEADAPDIDISIDDARFLIGREHGFESWQSLVAHVISQPSGRTMAAAPFGIFSVSSDGALRDVERTRDWDAAIETLTEKGLSGIDANGQMTDELLERISHVGHVTSLRLGGSKAVTDTGLRHLVRMPLLRELELSGTSITDRALDVVREMAELRKISLAWTAVTDAGAAHLAACDDLESVDLSMTQTGDASIRALAGKAKLRHFRSGNSVTDAAFPLFHQFPVFRTWQDGEVSLALTSPDAEPNSLWLRGTFTDRGLSQLVGLDGLFGLNVDDSKLQITATGLAPLVGLPHLGFLAFDATDEAMPYIAAMPRLRFLTCQDTVAGDDGFVALSRSRSIEYIWGRRCYNLRSRGFAALADMPALRALSVSCKNVDDAGLSALPRFPALRELMPMDVPDEGFRYVGECRALESLVLMYCRNTTDAATGHIGGLSSLRKYFASYTRITDRTPEILSGMSSLERIGLVGCPGVTNTGIASLARLPRLQELDVGGMQNVTRESLSDFPAHIQINFSP